MDKIPELRRLLEARTTYMADRAARRQAEMMGRVILDATEDRGTTQRNGTVDALINDFDEMILEMDKLEMPTPRMEDAASAQVVERMEESGKINTTEKPQLKETLEEPDNKPERDNKGEPMKREPKRPKVVENRDEPFTPPPMKETLTKHATNDKRSRIDDWKNGLQSRGQRRSESRQGYFRTTSRKYIRNSSQFCRRSSSRPTSRLVRGRSRIRSLLRGQSPANSTKERERSVDKPKNDLVKKVACTKDIEKMVKVEKQNHSGVKLQLGGTWKENEAVFLVAEGKNLDTELRKHIEKAPEMCQIDEENKRSLTLARFEPEGKKERDVKGKEQRKPEVREAKDGETEGLEEDEALEEIGDEEKKSKDTSREIEVRKKARSRVEEAEVKLIELGKEQVEEYVERKNGNEDLKSGRSSLVHRKKGHSKKLPNAKVSNNRGHKERKGKVENMVKGATDQ